jgi:dipeptidyl-peptidase-4
MRKIIFHIFILLLIIAQNAEAQKKTIDVETIYNPETWKMQRLPQTSWYDNSNLLFFDKQNPAVQLYDVKSGETTDLYDAEKASASLKAILGEEDSPQKIGWPLDFNSEVQKGIYRFKDDIFLLDFIKAKFIRITDTAEEEKSIKFSPDGKKISFVRENNIYIYDLDNKKEMPLTADGSENLLNGTLSWVYWEEVFGRHDIAYWWSGDSKAIAYLQTDESMVSLMHYVDFKPWVPDVIIQRYPKAGGENPQVKAGIVELKTRKTTWVQIDTASYEYLVRINWLPDSKRIAVQTMNRAQTELDLYLVQCKDGSAEKILKENSDAWVNINDDLHFLKGKKQFLWVSERDGYAHIYLFDMTGKMIRKITNGDWALISAGGGVAWLRQAVVAVDEENEWVYFTALKHSSIERHLYRVHFDGNGFKRLSQGAGTHSVSFSPDYKYYVDRFTGSKNPPSKTLYKNKGEKVRIIAESDLEALAQYNIQYPEYFTIKAKDGFPLPAMIYKPSDFDPNKKYPLILYVYGGPSAPSVVNRYQGISFDQVLLNNGFIVARVDPRSATSISKKLENIILLDAMDEMELKDLRDGVKWLKNQPYIDSSRVGIWGWSGGGSFTLSALTKTKEFKAGIAVAPVSDWHYYDTFYAEFAMKRPQDNPEGYERSSKVKNAKNIHGRLLLVYGTYDDNVHPQNSQAFANELIKHNIMFEMMVYPMRKHGISDMPARIHLYNTMLEFWNRNLKN